MKVWQENYGADADGNRGQLTTFAELETSDDEAVIEKLYEHFIDGTVDGTVEIEIDDFNFDVEIKDYLAELIEMARADESIKDDEDLQDYIEDTEQDLLIAEAERMNRINAKKAGVK